MGGLQPVVDKKRRRVGGSCGRDIHGVPGVDNINYGPPVLLDIPKVKVDEKVFGTRPQSAGWHERRDVDTDEWFAQLKNVYIGITVLAYAWVYHGYMRKSEMQIPTALIGCSQRLDRCSHACTRPEQCNPYTCMCTRAVLTL